VYAYLRSKGYEQARIVTGGYETVTNALLRGKQWKQLEQKKSNSARGL